MLVRVPLQIFFFSAFSGCLGIRLPYSAGILIGIQNSSCVPFQCGVDARLETFTGIVTSWWTLHFCSLFCTLGQRRAEFTLTSKKWTVQLSVQTVKLSRQGLSLKLRKARDSSVADRDRDVTPPHVHLVCLFWGHQAPQGIFDIPSHSIMPLSYYVGI